MKQKRVLYNLAKHEIMTATGIDITKVTAFSGGLVFCTIDIEKFRIHILENMDLTDHLVDVVSRLFSMLHQDRLYIEREIGVER